MNKRYDVVISGTFEYRSDSGGRNEEEAIEKAEEELYDEIPLWMNVRVESAECI